MLTGLEPGNVADMRGRAATESVTQRIFDDALV